LKSLYEQLRDADAYIKTATPVRWKDNIKTLVENQKPLPPEYAKTVDENFWELI